MTLKNRTALIIGGGAGLGRAIALAYAREGAKLAVADLTAATAQETLALASVTDGLALAMNIAKPAEIKAGIKAVTDRFGTLDIMVNCAAICLVDPLLEVTPERFDQVFNVNARGAFFCLTAAAEVMLPKKFGRIITISTPATKLAVANFATYGASKAAVDSFTRSCAVAWAPHGITVNSIVPGRMTGGMVDALDRDLAKLTGQDLAALAASRTKSLPMQRRVDPAEVAQAAVWLASDAGAYVTAERFNFTGGMELG
ncbi:MAG: 2-hydroxycyclohexanecarboxyl-CoA dehydrogenase [Verrucomicrobia bacterium]|jgi:NAD(P)-dependent dehydrogenase (short-subunit alcohol dehydrogenase family)|nr:MAG: 2-hydroxycyclohexanecarboxyl-CoA dehydrogenase [Verrucomicrobiota bacterium]